MPPGMWLRTSHKSFSILRTSGIPNGQPICTVFISSPIALRIVFFISHNQSRTGSAPLRERKRRTCNGGPSKALYLFLYITSKTLVFQGRNSCRSGMDRCRQVTDALQPQAPTSAHWVGVECGDSQAEEPSC